jgi:hypothetical protein
MTLKGSQLLERIVVLEQSVKAAHKRVDERDKDIQEIKSGVSSVASDVKEVVAWMNRGKGWAAAAMVLAGTIGALLTKAFATWFTGGTKT